MGYFDNAKASREEENSLEHSSGAWKKHKYIQKIGEGASAKYKYAKNKVKDTWNKDITGKAYKDEAEINRQKSEGESRWIQGEHAIGSEHKLDNARVNNYASRAEHYGRKSAEAEAAYRTKSLAGISKNTMDKGKRFIDDFFKPKVTVKTSSNLRDEGTTNIKNAERVTLKKNKLSFKKN